MSENLRPELAARPLVMTISRWWRACLVVLGLVSLGSGGVAVFVTQLEAGPVALLAVGLVLLLIGAGGRLPSRLKVGENEAAWEAVEGFISHVADEVPSEQTPQLVEALNRLAAVAPSVAAAGLGVVTERMTFERTIRDMLSEAVREVNRSEGAESLGGLSLVLDYQMAFGTKVDAAVMSGRGEYLAIEIKYSYGKVSLMEMAYLARKTAVVPSGSHALKVLFVSNQNPVSDVDVSYLERAFPSGQFRYVRVTDSEDIPKLSWAIRAAFQIHA
jgi:hypothetical protein